MAQAFINKTLDNIIMGVSQQYPEGRSDGQVEELINCVPSITRGMLRRNPIHTSNLLPNLVLGTEIPFTYSYDRGNGDEQYIFIIPGDALGSWFVYNINDVSKNWSGVNDYFKIPAGAKPLEVFKAITLRDYTFVVNTTVKTTADSTPNALPIADWESKALYWIKLTTQVLISQKTDSGTGVTGSRLEGYTYTLNAHSVQGIHEGRPGETAVDRLSAGKIITELASKEASWVTTPNSSFLWQLSTPTKWDWEDTNGSLASIGVWKTVASENELPARMPSALDGFIVKVTGGTTLEKDDYFLRYDHSTTTWNEVAEPGVSSGIDAATMPHILKRNYTTGVDFIVEEYDWDERKVGDIVTNKDPSFVGETINDIFFYKNRLGFLSNNNIILSTIKDYGSFYIRALRTILDDGPIDISVATIDSVTLDNVVTTEDTLVIFDADAQFLLHSNNDPLTPKTASITAISHYNYNTKLGARAIGDKTLFSSTAGGSASIFYMKVGLNDFNNTNVLAENISQHLPTYIDSDINHVTVDTGVGQIFIQSEVFANGLYVINTAQAGGEDVQRAFHAWTFKENIVGIHTLLNKLFIIFENKTLGIMHLELPADVSQEVYGDIDEVGTLHPYTSGIEFSRFYYKGRSNKGTERGRLQLRTMLYTVVKGSQYETFLENLRNYRSDVIANQIGPIWDDTMTWEDVDTLGVPNLWVDANPTYLRRYINDNKITVMSSSENIKAVFVNNQENPLKGFELQTVNIEALFYQRSSRVAQ